MKTLPVATLAAALLLSVAVQAQTPTDGAAQPPANTPHDHSANEPLSDKHQKVREDSKGKDDAAVDTLDGDNTPEGQHGDSDNPKNPGGAGGDGRNDPGMLE